jgi:Wnt-binding factor required for Wnt secretion
VHRFESYHKKAAEWDLVFDFSICKEKTSGIVEVIKEKTSQRAKAKCSEASYNCTSLTLASIQNIDDGDYLVSIFFKEITSPKTFSPEQFSMRLFSLSIAKEYSRFQLGQRIFCAFVSLLVLLLYCKGLRSVRIENRVWEQKMIMASGVLLIFYNNPFWNLMFFAYKKLLYFFLANYDFSFGFVQYADDPFILGCFSLLPFIFLVVPFPKNLK